MGTTSTPAYDAHADWYEGFISGGGDYLRRVHATVHGGVHPCFVGAFAAWGRHPSVVVDARYADRSRSFDSWNTSGVRVRVGAWHLPLADLVNATVAAGLRLLRVAETGPGGVPDLFGLLAVREG
ncbi:hypothetical protein HNR22_002173 [Micromonospora jinlongensis]|uniref:Uncharacterized protein n=1 Tax=Micromonospora jinlongensis TaxID=1287877 RepID=A0A7Z0BD28_9ACTN|nr:hypothetical protein [Micromonospora jinlongensis]NYH42446.1 hypothetical protein [Micromonospora jinlongensis]